jgi:hypothetical protein
MFLLKGADRKILIIVKYEDLVKNPKNVIRKLSKKTGFQFTKEVKEQLYKKSFMIRKETKEIRNYDPRTSWRQSFTKKETDSVTKIVREFNLEEYLDL